MSGGSEIFKKIMDGIKTGSHELLIFDGVDPDDFQEVHEGLQHHTNNLERRSIRYPNCSTPFSLSFITKKLLQNPLVCSRKKFEGCNMIP